MEYNVNITNGSPLVNQYCAKRGILTIPLSIFSPEIEKRLEYLFLDEDFCSKAFIDVNRTDKYFIFKYLLHNLGFGYKVSEMYHAMLLFRYERDFWINSIGLPDDESWTLTLELDEHNIQKHCKLSELFSDRTEFRIYNIN